MNVVNLEAIQHEDVTTAASALSRTITKPIWLDGHVSDEPIVHSRHGGTLVVDALGRALLCPSTYGRIYDDVGSIKQLVKPHYAAPFLLRAVLEDGARVERAFNQGDQGKAYVYGRGTLYIYVSNTPHSSSRETFKTCVLPDEPNGGHPFWRLEYGLGLADGLYGRPTDVQQIGTFKDVSTAPIPAASEPEWVPVSKHRTAHDKRVDVNRSMAPAEMIVESEEVADDTRRLASPQEKLDERFSEMYGLVAAGEEGAK